MMISIIKIDSVRIIKIIIYQMYKIKIIIIPNSSNKLIQTLIIIKSKSYPLYH